MSNSAGCRCTLWRLRLADFYSRLNAGYGSTPRGDIVIVMGVLNAKVGLNNSGVEYDVRRHGVGVRNDNGGRFVDFCSTFHLVIGGTTIQHRTRDKVAAPFW